MSQNHRPFSENYLTYPGTEDTQFIAPDMDGILEHPYKLTMKFEINACMPSWCLVDNIFVSNKVVKWLALYHY
jgi:hypothetical protein